MQRKLNLKLIGGILGGLLIAAAAVYLLHAWQSGRNAKFLLELADRTAADEDDNSADEKAETLYLQYLTFVPNDINAMQKYTELLDRQEAGPRRKPAEIVNRMERVLQAKPNEHKLRERFVHNLIALDRYSDAIVHLKKLLPAWDDKSEIWHRVGWCQEAKKEYPQAVTSLREALKLNPKRLDTSAILAEVLQIRLNQPDDALAVMDDAVTANADSWQAYLKRSRFHRHRANEKLADSDLQAALKLGPMQPDVIIEATSTAIVRAEALAVGKGYARAKALLEETGKAYPQEIIVWCARADLAMLQQHWAEAEAILEQAAAEKDFAERVELQLAKCRLWSKHGTPGDIVKLVRLSDAASKSPAADTRLIRELGDTWYRLGDWTRAERFFVSLAQGLPKDLTCRVYLLELALQKNQMDVARRWHEDIRRLEGEQGPLARFGGAALLVKEAHGDRKKLEAARKLIKELRPEYDAPRLALLSATIFEMEGEYQQAIGEYSKALEQGDPQPRVMARLLELLIERREFSKAEAELGRYELRRPLTKDLARLGAEVAVGTRVNEVAQRRAALAVALPSRDYRDYLWLARIHQGAVDSSLAESHLREAVALAGHAPDTWIALTEHLTQMNQRAQSLKELERLKQEIPAKYQPLALARCYEGMRMPVEARKAYEAALKERPNDFTVVAYAADFQRRADHANEARQLYEHLLSPDLAAPAEFTIKARRHLAVLLAERGDTAKAFALIDENDNVRSATIADVRIRLFIRGQSERERPACVQKFQESAQRQRATSDEYLLFARMLEATGQLGPARTHLADIVSQNPTAAHYLAPYVRVLIKIGELDEAQAKLNQLETLEPGSERLRGVKAALAAAKLKTP